MMDKLSITRAILSISSPGTHLTPHDDASARALTRRVNAYGADLKRRHPTRFGFFAALPLPDVAGALAEIEASIADGCDGFGILTNHHGVYLGDAAFAPVFAAFNKHKAKLFIHPTAGCLCGPTAYPPSMRPPDPGSATQFGAGPGASALTMATPLERHYPAPLMEFFFDTARALAHLFIQGVVRKNADIAWLIPHMGGCLPPLIYRLSSVPHLMPIHGADAGVTWESVRRAFADKFYFDMAGWPMRGQLEGLLVGAGIGKERLLYGSDFPFTQARFVEPLMEEMDEGIKAWSVEDREAASWRTAEGLFGDGSGVSGGCGEVRHAAMGSTRG